MVCLYCGNNEIQLAEKGKRITFSKEHILPSALIGKPKNNPFTIKNVCEDCNNMAGVYIDAPAIKSFYMQMYKSLYENDYAAIEEKPVLPLTRMGSLGEITYNGKVAESYFGPAQDMIFHFHDPYPQLKIDYPAVMGIPPQLKKQVDKGFVIVFLGSNNPVWWPTIIKSLLAAFKGSKFYAANFDKPSLPEFFDLPTDMNELVKQLRALDSIPSSFSHTAFSENRFIAKVALGLGAKFLGEEFIQSPMANKLRQYMWTVTNEERSHIPLMGSSFFDPNKPKTIFEEYLSWDYGHLLSFLSMNDSTILHISLFGKINALIRIENNGNNYSKQIGHSKCYAISPALNRTILINNYLEFTNHKYKIHGEISELNDIEKILEYRKANKPPRFI